MKKYAINKRLSRDFEVLDKYEAGIALLGSEVKSIRFGGANLSGGFVYFDDSGAWLHGVDIQKWKTSSDRDYDSFRKRKILLKKKETLRLTQKTATKGISVVPTSLYPKGRMIKIGLALVRGKQQHRKDADKIRREEKVREKRNVKEFLRH